MSDRPTLLVALNLAGDAETLCLKAAGLARRMGADVVLLHVVELPVGVSADAPVRVMDAPGPTSARDMLRADAVKHLEPLIDLMRMHGTDAELLLRSGRAPEQVAAVARELAPLMILVGSDVATGLRRLFQTSVTEAIILATDVPVLVVKGDPGSAAALSTGQMQAAAENDG